ncbi:MAG: hypothetical protein KAQ96_14960, partial [Thermoplasmata archaeon]|nr:hypothetical protein [Thermoplasmata archaeon]
LLSGAVVTLINPGDLDPSIAWFGAIIGVFGVLAVLGQVVRFGQRPRASRGHVIRRAGSIMIHLGLALVFMAYCLSNVPVLPETQGLTPSEDVPVDHGEYSAVISDRVWTRDTGVSDRGEDWDTFDGELRLYKDGSLVSSGSIKVISSWKYREYGTLTYREDGLTKRMAGEVVASELRDDHLIIRFQSFRESGRSVVVDLFDPTTSLDVWPGLSNDADILEGEVIRIRNDTTEWKGFLIAVEGEGGNVTLRKFDGTIVTIPGGQVDRLYRKAYIGLTMTDVSIHMTLVKDVYITILSTNPSPEGGYEAMVMVSEVPAMSFLWTGMALMSLGVVLRPLERYAKGVKYSADEDGPPDGEDEIDTMDDDESDKESDEDES